MAVAAVVLTGPLGAAAGGQADDDELAAPVVVSPALFAEADALAAQLPSARLAVDAAATELTLAEDDLATARDELDRRHDDDDAAGRALAELAVAAYTSGGVVPDDLVVALLTSDGFSVDVESRLLLVETVADTLVDRRQRSRVDLTGAEASVSAAEASVAEHRQRLDQAAAAHDDLVTREGEARRRAEEARAAEEAEASRRAFEAFLEAVRQAELRAATPLPVSHRSGVVPPTTVPALLAARVGGEIPPTALNAYWRGAGLVQGARPGCGVDWALLAAIGKVETGHGTFRGTVVAPDGSTNPVILGPPLDGGGGFLEIRDTDGGRLDGDPIVDRAVGPMQFIPSTWRAYAADGNGDGVADPHNQYDAVLAAAHYLCRSGGGWGGDTGSAPRAVRAYNRSSAYVAEVLRLADHFRVLADPSAAATTTTTPDLPDDPDDPGRPPLIDDPGPDPEPGTPTTTTTTTTPRPTTTAPGSTTTTSTTAPGTAGAGAGS